MSKLTTDELHELVNKLDKAADELIARGDSHHKLKLTRKEVHVLCAILDEQTQNLKELSYRIFKRLP